MNEFITNCLDTLDDKKDERDYQLASVMPQKIDLPKKFLCENLSPVFRQKYGSCTSAASVNGCKEQQESKNLSEYFNYVNSKKLSGIYDQQGEYLRNALRAICKYGVCLQELFPDVYPPSGQWIDYVKKEPSTEAYKDAERFKGKTYWSMDKGIDNFKGALAVYKSPVLFVMDWFKSYNSCNGVLPLPDVKVGAHALACVGYNTEYLIVKNSFGTGWGHKGYFYIPFKDFDKHTIFHPFVLLDLPTKNKKMKLFIDKNNDQVFGDKELQFGYSIPNEKKLEEITTHCAKLGIKLEEPEKNDMIGWYIVSGTTAFGWKQFLNF